MSERGREGGRGVSRGEGGERERAHGIYLITFNIFHIIP